MWESQTGSDEFAGGFPVLLPGTARLPRPLWGLAMTNLAVLPSRVIARRA